MAEAALFSVASKLLSTIASPAFTKAYEKGLSIWDAMDELDKLKITIKTVQAVLLDAEKKQESSDAVKDWIRRVSDVLYDADDLFDEVATDAMLKQQIKADKPLNKVRVSCFKLNPIVSRNSIAVKVKAIRKSLVDISTDMAGFGFALCDKEEEIHTRMRRGREQGSFVDPKNVIGRDEEKKAILEFLLTDSDSAKPNAPVVISIVGIGGMGKTTLAQLIYNDDEVKKNFIERWFSCISDTSDEKEVIGKIFQSICEKTQKSYSDFTVSQLENKIRESVEGKKFLLVLDDVWDEDHSRWQYRLSLLSGGAKGSKIIVTTRSLAVSLAGDAFKICNLGGLSEADSWDLFKRAAFAPGKENDRRWADLGREIVKKCANVPLAIRSIGSLLYTKTTLREWESFKEGEFSKLEQQSGDPVMNALKVSYEPLPSSLKHCFGYCSLFPKDFKFDVRKLIYLWIAQGYIKPNHEMQTVEQVGHSYFMDLLRRGFFQEGVVDHHGDIKSCKMHDLVHDLAQIVAGEETALVPMPTSQFKHSARHVGVGCERKDSWENLALLVDIKRVRSVVFTIEDSSFRLALDQRFTNLKGLRALSLQRLGIENVSSCIGELKHLRYLDLSHNNFESLPDSMTNLVNLLTLFLTRCSVLKALPVDFRKLINLRYLNILNCDQLKYMPPGMGELTNLQYLSQFKVEKATEGVKASGLDELGGLKQLRDGFSIEFDDGIEDWKGDECWRLPVSPEEVMIWCYPGVRVPCWANQLPNLASLHLNHCLKVKYLPPLRCLPNLKSLHIWRMYELEYMEEEDMHSCAAKAGSFFPCLEELKLCDIPKMKGWRREVESTASSPVFVSLSRLRIAKCPELKSIPLCSRLRQLTLVQMDSDGVMEQLVSNKGGSSCNPSAPSTSPCPSPLSSLEEILIRRCSAITSFSDAALTSLQRVTIEECGNLNNLHMESPHLRDTNIDQCHRLISVHVEAPAASLSICGCNQLKILQVAHPNVLEYLEITGCPEFELWEQDKRGLDWNSFCNLRTLWVDPISDLDKLPDCLRHLQADGQLHISYDR